MKLVLSLFLVLVFLINLTSCQNPYRRPGQTASQNQSYISPSTEKSNVSTDPYRVDSKQYDQFFVMRYGLLYQKHSDVPFTGRIVQVNNGNEGKYVSSDENWSNGKKHGQSTKWFSNGTKMYERNYKDGKWHGAVTRWWPNGQRMYVTAYTEGVRNGREAKWKSDGTPLNISSDSNNDQIEIDPAENTSTEESDSEPPPVAFPSVDISPPPASTGPSLEDTTNFEDPSSPALPVLNEPLPSIESNPDGLPSIPELPSISDSNEATPSLPELPGISDSNEATPSLPELPGISDSNEATPSLPELPGSTDTAPGEELPALPGLPMDPSAESGETSPELPGLPPLPSSSSDSGDLPPLPPLP